MPEAFIIDACRLQWRRQKGQVRPCSSSSITSWQDRAGGNSQSQQSQYRQMSKSDRLLNSASKASVAGMTLLTARDHSCDLIRTNIFSPDVFNTPLLVAESENVKMALGAQVPNPARLADPEEFAFFAR